MKNVNSSRGPAPPPADDVLAGTPYRALGRIGRGGMGEVLAAEHVALGKRVVVKLLHSALADRADHVDRMRLEAQALARLAHPNLVVVHDYGRTADARPYMVMEELIGRTLRAEIKQRGPLPALEAIDLARQALAGLDAAHAVGIVHRDVKLDNLFVCGAPGGPRTLKVLDFGIAKVLPTARSDASPAPLAYPTEEGVALGTPRYFAPEQARGVAVDARTDLYSTGLVLYALLAGRGPFDHLHAIYELALAQAEEVPELPSVVAGVAVPPAVESLVMRAIAKRPEDRFQSAAEFSTELARVATRLEAAAAAAVDRGAPQRTQAMPRTDAASQARWVNAPAAPRAQALPSPGALPPAQALPNPANPWPAQPPREPRRPRRTAPLLEPVVAPPPETRRAAPQPEPPRSRRLRPPAFVAVVVITAAVVASAVLGLLALVAGPAARGVRGTDAQPERTRTTP